MGGRETVLVHLIAVVFNGHLRQEPSITTMNQGASAQRLRPFKPQRFGRYTLLMPISTGGMGEVFLARLEGAHGFDKLCVIKKILPHLAENAEFTERFVNEGRVLVKLSHGNIAQVLDMGLFDNAAFIALEFIDGKDLRRILARMRDRQLPIPLSFVLYVMTRVLDALAYAHRKVGDDERPLNLVHRDVSPQNVLLSYEGEVKIIDFGLAKSTLSSAKTNPSIVLGKFRYMSPEQAQQQPVDRRSDLYTVGLCLYELIAGHSPFDSVSADDLLVKVAHPDIVPLTTAEPMCPQSLADAVNRALAVDPHERWQTAEELRSCLQVILNDIDPTVSRETASRFMRDAFAAEYHAERKMLAALRERAKQVEATDLTGDTLTDLMPVQVLEPNPLGVAAVILPEPVKVIAPGGPTETIEPAPLSFEATKKTPAAVRRAEQVEAHADTQPSISLRARDTDETLDPVKEVPSVVLDGVEAWPQPQPAPSATDDEPTQPQPPPAKASGSRAEVSRGQQTTSPRPKSKPGRALVAKVAPKVSAPRKERSSARGWLLLPVLAALAVAGYIAWDVYGEQLKVQFAEVKAKLDDTDYSPLKSNP